MLGADLAGEVSTDAGYVVEPEGPQRFTVAALDLGIKTNTPRNFAAARHPQPRAAVVGDLRRRSPTSSRTGCSCPTGRATRPPPTTWSR